MPLTILHIEDYRPVAETVRDALEAEGWRVVTCARGYEALNELAGGAHYDLLITDNQPPDADGLEIVRFARALPRRAGMPILMFTASGDEAEARRAGVDAYLKKPEGFGELVSTASKLLGRCA